jgi:hypothetical protein
MTKTDLKIMMNQVIEKNPEPVHHAVLGFVIQIHKDSSNKLTLPQNFGKMLSEDRELLQRLPL